MIDSLNRANPSDILALSKQARTLCLQLEQGQAFLGLVDRRDVAGDWSVGHPRPVLLIAAAHAARWEE